MINDIMPTCWNEETKPHLFCPGCGHGLALKNLGYAIDNLKITRSVTLGIDIGCSLLAWNFFNFDTVQTHHGRTTSVMLGYKRSRHDRIVIAYMGDGGGYAIGLQALLHSAYRNEPITVILINNELYGMTGGQMSPTTEIGVVTATSPLGKDDQFGPGFHGPELIKQVANKNAYVARASISNPIQLEKIIEDALMCQKKTNNFSFVEILSICPINWKTNAKNSFDRLIEMEKFYHIGVLLNDKEEK